MNKKIKGVYQSFIISLLLFMVLPSGIIGFLFSGSKSITAFFEVVIFLALLDIGANILNNYSDWKIDIINNKRKDLHDAVSSKGLLKIYFFITLIPILLLFLLSASIYLILSVLLFIVLGLIYSVGVKIKDITPLNYIAIGLAYGAVPFSIGFFSGSSSLKNFIILIPILFFLSLVTFSYTITKDYPDIKGDKANNKRTLPVILGKKKAIFIQAILIIFSYLFLLFLVIFNILNKYFLLTLPSFAFAMYILYKVLQTEKEESLKKIALYNKLNHFILRILLLLIIILIL